MASTTRTDEAWGLELGGSFLRLARVARIDGRLVVREIRRQELPDRWTAAPDVPRAMAALAAARVAGPLAVAVPDELVLLRFLSLPRAAPAVLGKVVRGQLEAMLPAAPDQFAASWCPSGGPAADGQERIALCAARAAEIGRILRQAGVLGGRIRQVVPSAWAVAALCGRIVAAGERLLVLDVAARTTTLMLLDARRIAQCAVIDVGGDHWTERIAECFGLSIEDGESVKTAWAAGKGAQRVDRVALEALMTEELGFWARQVREAREAWPAGETGGEKLRCILVGGAASWPALAVVVATALGTSVEPMPRLAGVDMPAGAESISCEAAVGAAICALDGRADELNLLAAPAAVSAPLRSFRWRWAGAAAWVVAGLLLLYAQDARQAGRLRGTLDRVAQRAAAEGGLDRRLAVARQLQPPAAGPLAVLDEISAAAPKEAMLTSWDCTRDGQVTVAGVVPGEQQFQAFLEGLRESPIFTQVGLISARKDKDRFRFEISLRVAESPRRDRPMLAARPRKDASPGGGAGPGQMPGPRQGPGGVPAAATPPAGPPDGAASPPVRQGGKP